MATYQTVKHSKTSTYILRRNNYLKVIRNNYLKVIRNTYAKILGDTE